MFLTLSKTFAKVGGVRFGLGLRITKNNAIWMAFIWMFVAMFQLVWYMLVLCFWLMYALFYGIYWGIKKLIEALKK